MSTCQMKPPPPEAPEERAARFGYRINPWGSWVEAGEPDGPAPFLARFAVRYACSPREKPDHQELQHQVHARRAAANHQEGA